MTYIFQKLPNFTDGLLCSMTTCRMRVHNAIYTLKAQSEIGCQKKVFIGKKEKMHIKNEDDQVES